MDLKEIDLYIFHHHLLPGGVTDVIKHSLTAFSNMDCLRSITVVRGRKEISETFTAHIKELQGKGLPLSLVNMPEIDYLGRQQEELTPAKLQGLLIQRFSSPQALWLVHNYHLGKNWVFTQALNNIVQKGSQKIIYQIHDFPECGRHANLNLLKDHIPDSLYPESPWLRYCVINSRDYKIMQHSGMSRDEIHLLENPVLQTGSPADPVADKKLLIKSLMTQKPEGGLFHPDGEIWLYPVRAIRRKNILEGGFLCRLMKKEVNLVLTLPGLSKQEKAYSGFCQKAWNQGLVPGFWGSGTLPEEAGISYGKMIAASDLVFSSSVQEGFGYMYLNSMLWEKPLLSRYLDIMEGFLPLFETYPSHFYNTILIPGDKKLKKSLEKTYRKAFGRAKNLLTGDLGEKLEQELRNMLSRDTLEFSYLSAEDQYRQLENLNAPGYCHECQTLNAELLGKAGQLTRMPIPRQEKDVLAKYGEQSYRESFSRILDSFSRFESKRAAPRPVDEKLQQEFSKLEFFRLLYQ